MCKKTQQMKYTKKQIQCQVKNEIKSLMLHYMQCDERFKPYIDATSSVSHGKEYVFKPELDPRKSHCKNDIPRSLADIAAQPSEKKKTRALWRYQLKVWEDVVHGWEQISPSSLIKIINIVTDNTIKMFYKNQDGSFSVKTGRQKCTPFYNMCMQSKMFAKGVKLADCFEHFYFLTLTYAVNAYGEIRYDAWHNYNKHYQPVLRWLREKFNAAYVWCLESTEWGYPHIHIVFGTHKEIDFKGVKRISDIEGTDTDFYKDIQPYLKSPQFWLEKAKGRNVAGYICKYISKSTATDLHNMKVPKDSDARGELLKNLGSMVYPMLCHCRQFGTSEHIEDLQELPERAYKKNGEKRHKSTLISAMKMPAASLSVSVPQFQVDWTETVNWFCENYAWDYKALVRTQAMCAHFHKTLDDNKLGRAERANLDTLLINLTKSCVLEIRQGSGKEIIDLVGREDKDFSADNVELWEQIRKKTRRIGCWGCPLMRFALMRMGYDVEPFSENAPILPNGKPNWEKLCVGGRLWEIMEQSGIVSTKVDDILRNDKRFKMCFEDDNEMEKYLAEKMQDSRIASVEQYLEKQFAEKASKMMIEKRNRLESGV